MACGPCIVATISGMVTNGPTPIMSIMFSAVACHSPIPRTRPLSGDELEEEGEDWGEAGMWTNSTRPAPSRQSSQLTMSVSAAAAASDTGLDRARSEPATPAIGSNPASRSHSWHRRSALTGIAPTRQSGNALAASRDARPVAHRTKEEQPFVVMAAGSFVDLERGFLALAADPHHSASRLASESGSAGKTRGRETAARGGRAQTRGRRGTAAPATLLLRGRSAFTGHAAGRVDDVPFAALIHRQRQVVLRHGILVFLSKKTSLDQDVEARRVTGASHFSHVEVDAAGNLLPSENEFGFFLALHLGAPDRHGDRHEHHHHGKRHQQGRHRVAPLAVLTTR